MAVIVKYFVVRNGIELEEVFTEKKTAEAYDKMLDAAEALESLIKESELGVKVDDQALKDISIVLAKNGPKVMQILKGVKSPTAAGKQTREKSDASAGKTESDARDTKKRKAAPKGK